jgi:membrane associated rhomboid family serine protease
MLFPLYDLNPHHRFPLMTVVIIAMNIAITAWLGAQPSSEAIYRYGFIPARVSHLNAGQPIRVQTQIFEGMRGARPGPVIVLPSQPAEVYLTFLTTMFMHGGWMHVLMNMWMLWVFGNNIEERLGSIMFLIYYLLGGLVGTACQFLVDPSSTVPVIGASGAVATVLGGYAITYPKAVVKTLVFFGLILILDLPALLVLGIWFVVQMLSGLAILPAMGPPVAFWAHIGGFLAGIALMPVMGLGAAPPGSNWHQEVDELFRFDDPRTRTESK